MIKNLVFLLLLTGSFAALQAQTNAPAASSPEVVQLKESKYDFGKIQQGRPVTHVFELVNTGNEPLKLDNVQASCGCTTPEWSHDPIAAGATSKITVGYNAASEGVFTKTVTISYKGDQTKTIIISGNVFKSPATSAPENSSISLLKQ